MPPAKGSPPSPVTPQHFFGLNSISSHGLPQGILQQSVNTDSKFSISGLTAEQSRDFNPAASLSTVGSGPCHITYGSVSRRPGLFQAMAAGDLSLVLPDAPNMSASLRSQSRPKRRKHRVQPAFRNTLKHISEDEFGASTLQDSYLDQSFSQGLPRPDTMGSRRTSASQPSTAPSSGQGNRRSSAASSVTGGRPKPRRASINRHNFFH